MGTRTILILVVAALTGLSTAGCSSSAASTDGRISVVTSFYPLEAAAAAVGGDRVDVTDLTPPGVEPHDLELSTDQLDSILDADVVLYLGGGFQPAVEDAVRQRGSDQLTVDVLHELGSAVHAPGVGTAEGNETADPHVWLDPTLMSKVVDVVARTLGRAASTGGGSTAARSGFRQRAATMRRELRTLDGEYRRGLTGCRSDVIVTTHAAFGYLAARYGLRQEAMTGLSPEGEPDPAQLARIEDLVRREHVTTVFTEPLATNDVAQTVARETGTKVAVLDPIESLTAAAQGRHDDYFSIMRSNLATLREALGCTG